MSYRALFPYKLQLYYTLIPYRFYYLFPHALFETLIYKCILLIAFCFNLFIGMFYITKNPYHVSMPKYFAELKLMEEKTELFLRIDFLGVIKDSVNLELKPSKKGFFFFLVSGDAPKELEYDASFHKLCLMCDCCKINDYLGDGVIRLILSKVLSYFCSTNFLTLNLFFLCCLVN